MTYFDKPEPEMTPYNLEKLFRKNLNRIFNNPPGRCPCENYDVCKKCDYMRSERP